MVCWENARDISGSLSGSAGPTGVCGVDRVGAGDRSNKTNKGQANGLKASSVSVLIQIYTAVAG